MQLYDPVISYANPLEVMTILYVQVVFNGWQQLNLDRFFFGHVSYSLLSRIIRTNEKHSGDWPVG